MPGVFRILVSLDMGIARWNLRLSIPFVAMKKTLECDEYDALLTEAEVQEEKCLTTHADFKAKDCIFAGGYRLCRYLENNLLASG